MSGQKHTAGKLEIGLDCAVSGWVDLHNSDGKIVGSMRTQAHEVNQANAARVIQCWNAHDQLVEALERLLPMIGEWHAEFPEHVGDNELPAIEHARAALAAATGEA